MLFYRTSWATEASQSLHMLSIKTDSVISSTGLGKWVTLSQSTKKRVQWNNLNKQTTAIYVSEQVCIEWRRTGVHYTAKLTFSTIFLLKFWVRIIQVCILYLNFYSRRPVSQWVVFKTALLVWKCVHHVAPVYLTDLCIPATATSGRQHHLWSATTNSVGSVCIDCTWIGSFGANRSTTWNSLPPALWSPERHQAKTLKTYLFSTTQHHWSILCDSSARYK